jgi:LysM repeat protein
MNIRRLFILFAVVILLLAGVTTAFAQNQTYLVQPGDTLFSIARSFGLTVQQIAAANGITNPALIYAGQVLIIPGGGGSPPPGNPGPVTYTVQPGDTLFYISLRFGTTVNALVTLNGIANPDVLYVGQILVISGGSGQPPPTQSPPTQPHSPPTDVTYVVQPGDTLGQIALRFGTTYQQIALLNGIANPDRIFVGQTLIIRQGVTPTPVPTSEPTSEPTAEPTVEPTTEPTAEPTAEPTVEPTAEPTSEPTAEPTDDPDIPTPIVPVVTVPANLPNRFANPGFEGSVRPVIFGEVNVYEDWEPFYCDEPYTATKCPALRQGSGNPPGLQMGRPEYKPTDIGNRVHSGLTAQQWFCFWRTCDAGVFQTITTTPGATCEAGAYVQSWSANGTGFTSDLQTADQRANSTWFIRIDTSGGTNAFANNVLISRGFGYSDGIYDKYVRISYTFTATSNQTTVFFENLRIWPISNNDNYIDDAYLRCTN